MSASGHFRTKSIDDRADTPCGSSSGQSSLLSTQRAWILERDKKCDVGEDAVSSYEKSRKVAKCFSEMTMARMDELLNINGTPRYDFSRVIDMMTKEDFLR